MQKHFMSDPDFLNSQRFLFETDENLPARHERTDEKTEGKKPLPERTSEVIGTEAKNAIERAAEKLGGVEVDNDININDQGVVDRVADDNTEPIDQQTFLIKLHGMLKAHDAASPYASLFLNRNVQALSNNLHPTERGRIVRESAAFVKDYLAKKINQSVSERAPAVAASGETLPEGAKIEAPGATTGAAPEAKERVMTDTRRVDIMKRYIAEGLKEKVTADGFKKVFGVGLNEDPQKVVAAIKDKQKSWGLRGTHIDGIFGPETYEAAMRMGTSEQYAKHFKGETATETAVAAAPAAAAAAPAAAEAAPEKPKETYRAEGLHISVEIVPGQTKFNSGGKESTALGSNDELYITSITTDGTPGGTKYGVEARMKIGGTDYSYRGEASGADLKLRESAEADVMAIAVRDGKFGSTSPDMYAGIHLVPLKRPERPKEATAVAAASSARTPETAGAAREVVGGIPGDGKAIDIKKIPDNTITITAGAHVEMRNLSNPAADKLSYKPEIPEGWQIAPEKIVAGNPPKLYALMPERGGVFDNKTTRVIRVEIPLTENVLASLSGLPINNVQLAQLQNSNITEIKLA